MCDDDLIVEFTSKKCILKKRSCIGGGVQRAGGMYLINLQRASNKANEIAAVTVEMLRD